MDGLCIILSEASQTEKDKYHISLILIYKTETRLTDTENRLMVTKGVGRKDKFRVWDQQIHITMYKIDIQ